MPASNAGDQTELYLRNMKYFFNREDELLDLVDKDDLPIGVEYRSCIYQRGLNNFRVINGFIVNDLKKVWIPIRSDNQLIFPGALDVSFGGHVKSGETYFDAMSRELMEECKINILEVDYRCLGYFTPIDGFSAFMNVYVIYYNQIPTYDSSLFKEVHCMTRNNLESCLYSQVSRKGDFNMLLHLLLKNEL